MTAESTEGRVQAALRERGYTFETVGIDEADRKVTIDGDMIADLDELLADSNASPHLGAARESQGGETLVEKGYYASVSLTPHGEQTYQDPDATNVRLVFNSVSSAWVTAFNQAAAQWSGATCIEFTSSGAQTITIGYGTDGSDVYASALLPRSTFSRTPPFVIPGAGVTLNSATSGGIESLSANLKLQVALHELGHTLGFLHPTEGTPVSGTSSGNGYSTVMVARFGEPGIGSLTGDDVATRDIVFAAATTTDARGQVFTTCPTR